MHPQHITAAQASEPQQGMLASDSAATTCRDAASCELELSALEDVRKGFEAACFTDGGQEVYGPLADAVGRTAAWLRARAERPDVRPGHGSGQRFEGVWGSLEVCCKILFRVANP